MAAGGLAWAILTGAAVVEGLWAWAAICAVSLGLTVWLGVRWGDRIATRLDRDPAQEADDSPPFV